MIIKKLKQIPIANVNDIIVSVYSRRCLSTISQKEPEKPSLKTSIPGPKSQKLMQELSAIQVLMWNSCKIQ